jgi:hypothetical protein
MKTYRIKFRHKSREQIKSLDKYLKQHAKSYTGLAGKEFCFSFYNEQSRLQFIEEFKQTVDVKSETGYQFFNDHAIIG